MAHLTTSVEYAVHCLLLLAGAGDRALSARDLAELQGISPSFLAKIFPRLEKAGIVTASEGVRGGYRLARTPDAVSVLDIVDAVEGPKPLFECQEVRRRYATFGGEAPDWICRGTCGVHAAMLRAEEAMRQSLARDTLASLTAGFVRIAPPSFGQDVAGWMDDRLKGRAGRSRPPAGDPSDEAPD
ncbi:RrF2 family transcriptional regulator [Zavarzinia sp. CC-PAN008]|uniref:RrF2 family transcriptional regulator n=1 Tax=Zavarzinia sp. CC-PAN008 TaxID=3243332 RepID=UPI003F747DFD